jgi:D-glycero-D-manno-heptose 1,7-bisphosphate phosphatase
MKLIILDRDGTINEDRDDFVKSADEWIALPNALEAIAKLNHAGYTVVIATNQSGLGRGLYDVQALNAMHNKMDAQLKPLGGRVDAIFFCPHKPEENCACRKPLPGLFQQIKERYALDMTHVHTVGDSLRDLQAGAAVSCKTHLVRTGKSQFKAPVDLPSGTHIHNDLMAFADYLLTTRP